jgi:DNA polymerase/3'-5' exonuclease PolX
MEQHHDFQLTMTRKEVENIAEWVRLQIWKIDPEAHVVICGGYRRGKEICNDVDLMITCPYRIGAEFGLLSKIVHRLKGKGASSFYSSYIAYKFDP